ncbi:MAG: proteasome component M29 [Candelina submexicana]|nr:MAG: proteasome component M29 [Candelina submexicana]
MHVKQLFASSWDENVGGSRAVLLYLEEIVALAKHSLNAAQWEIKHTTSRAVADAVLSCGNELNLTSAALLWPVLNDALGGKTWEGKERVLDAFIVFIQKAPHFWKGNASVARDMEKLVIRESKRRNVEYRRYALRDLGLFAEIRDDIDMYSDILDIVAPIMEDLLKDETEMDIGSEFGDPLSGTTRDATVANAISALFLTINFNNISRRDLTMRLTTILQSVSKAVLTGSMVIQAAIIKSEKLLLEKLYKQDAIVDDLSSGQLDRLLLDLLLTLYKGRMDGTEQIRELRADVTVSLGKILSQGASPLIAFLKDTVTKARADERSSKIQLTLDSALECLEQ